MKILWVEDQYLQPERFGLENAIICQNIETAFEFIVNHQDEFDTVVLDINLEIGVEIESVLNRLKEIVPLRTLIAIEEDRKNELEAKAGLYLFLYLLNSGFPKDRVCFLTGNKSGQESGNPLKELLEYLEMYTFGNIKCQNDFDSLLDRLAADVTFKNEIPNKTEVLNTLDNIVDKVFDEIIDDDIADNIEHYYEAFQWDKLHNLLEEQLQVAIEKERLKLEKNRALGMTSIQSEAKGRNTYDSFKGAFEKTGLRAPLGFAKDGQAKEMQQWVSTKNTPYYKLRRGLIDLSILGKEVLQDNKKSNMFFTFQDRYQLTSNDKEDVYNVDFFVELLESLVKLLPIQEPEDNKTKKMYYTQIMKKLVHPWEGVKFARNVKDKIYFQTMKLLRNWVSHSKLNLRNNKLENEMAYIILMSFYALFNMEMLKNHVDNQDEDLLVFNPNKRLIKNLTEIEDNLFQLINDQPITYNELVHNINNEEIPLYSSLEKVKRKLHYSSNITFYSLLEELGHKRGNYEECGVESLMNLSWHGLFDNFYIEKVQHNGITYKINMKINYQLETIIKRSEDTFLTKLLMHTYKFL